jgi:hypothetical protein
VPSRTICSAPHRLETIRGSLPKYSMLHNKHWNWVVQRNKKNIFADQFLKLFCFVLQHMLAVAKCVENYREKSVVI